MRPEETTSMTLDEARAFRMPFGKHKGESLGSIPEDYIRWLSNLPDLREPLNSAVLEMCAFADSCEDYEMVDEFHPGFPGNYGG